MKVGNFSETKNGSRHRVAATVTWEDCGRPAHDVYFETDERFSDSLTLNPNAFLLACAIPAMHYGEKRVFMDAEICPELLEGLGTAMSWLREWYYKPEEGCLTIETKGLQVPSYDKKAGRAGFFFSGGIDSFATLRANRMHFPPEHPRAIRDGILVYGLEQDDPELFTHVLTSLTDVADKAGIALVPVYTNIYLNYRQEDATHGFKFWGDKFGGAALSAVAHAFARRFDSVSIAATYSTRTIEPWGSHPLLDPNYSSHDLRILHDGIRLTRLDKVKLVAGWDVALQNIRVCNRYKHYQAGMLNCGRCEKCVRTMLALTALGVLERTRAFPEQDVSPELLMKSVDMTKSGYDVFMKLQYEELLGPLSAVGRHDLVRVIERKLSHQTASPWKEKMRQFDRKYLGNNLTKLKRFIFHA